MGSLGLEVGDVESAVVTVVRQNAKELEVGALALDEGIIAGKEQNEGHLLGDALKVFEDVVGADVRVNEADAGEKEDLAGGGGKFAGDERNKLVLGVGDVLKGLEELVPWGHGLFFEEALPAVAGAEQFDGQVVKAEQEHRDAAVAQPRGQRGRQDVHLGLEGGMERRNEERHFITEAASLKEPRATNHLEVILEPLVQIFVGAAVHVRG